MHTTLTITAGQAARLAPKLRAMNEAIAVAQDALSLVVEGHGVTDCAFVSLDGTTLIVDVLEPAPPG